MFIKNTKYITKFEKKNIHARILGAIFSFLVSIVTFVGYINNIDSSDTISLLIVAIMFIVSIAFGSYLLYSFQKINTKGKQIFREFYKKFLEEKNNSTTITSLKKQKNLIKEMQEISWQVFSIPERKNINYEEELKRIEESIETLKQYGKITSSEHVYDIAEKILENIENPKTIIPSENLLKNQELFLYANNKNGRSILVIIIFFGLSTITAHAFQQTTLGIICMCCGVGIFIWNFVKNYTIDEYKFAKFLENISQYSYLIDGAREYYKLSLKEKGNLPELSLLFGDIVTILSQNISERKNLILEYKKVWNYMVSPFPFVKRKFPEEVEIFINEQQQKIIQDSIDLQKFILLWRESEMQKIQSLHIEQEIPELALQSKRREILLQNLQKLG